MNGPLEGIKVIELARNAPGAFSTMLLGDLGADILRVDQMRGDGREVEPGRGAAEFRALNRNKQSIALNLKDPQAQHILHSLCEKADVFIEGYRPGVTARLGCDYETIRKINPRMVYCSISGYGQDGPYQQLAGHDINFASFSGVASVMGRLENEPPLVPMVNMVADYGGGGMMAVMGTLSALMAREKTGVGQHVDISLLDSCLSLMAVFASDYFGRGEVPKQGGGILWQRFFGQFPYYNLYRCKDGKYLSIACLEPQLWENLCRALDRGDLIPHQHNTERHPELFRLLEEQFRARPRDEWFDELRSRGDIPVARVLELDEVFQDPQVLHRNMKVEAGQVDGKPVYQIGVAPKFSATPGSIRRLGPEPGQHTDEVLSSLGYPKARVQALREAQTVG